MIKKSEPVCDKDCFNFPFKDCISPDKDKSAAKQRAYYQANKAKLAAKQRAYREANKDKLAAQN